MNKKKNIIFFDHQTEMGGAEFYLYEMVKKMDKTIFDTTVCVGGKGSFQKKLQQAGSNVIMLELPGCLESVTRDPRRIITVMTFMKSLWRLPFLIRRIFDILKKYKADYAVVNTIKSCVFVVPAAVLRRVKVIVILHDYLQEAFFKRFFIKIILYCIKKSYRVICVSNDIKRVLDDLLAESVPSNVIYNGVDSQRFNPNIVVDGLRQELGIGNAHVISCVGRLEPWKGQKVFIRAAHNICARRNDIIFLIAGGALFQRQEYENECRVLVDQLGIKDKVLFLEFREDVEKIIALSDIIVHSSVLPEPFGRVVLETMACARLVITIASGGTREVITPDTGIMLETSDPDFLADAIIRYIDDPAARKAISHVARRRAVEFFDSEKIAKQWECVFLP